MMMMGDSGGDDDDGDGGGDDDDGDDDDDDYARYLYVLEFSASLSRYSLSMSASICFFTTLPSGRKNAS